MKSILSFLCNTFFEDGDEQKNNEMKRIFGKLLMPDLMTMMIDESIAPAVPSNRYNLHDFEPIAKAATEFERHCEQYYGFDVITDSDVTTLRSYINNIDKHYALKRSGKILQEGRNVMVRRLYDTDKVEEQTDRHTYKYQVTQTPQLLSVLISDTFSEAATLQADGHLTSAKTLIEGIRDLLDMYRAIMPSFHRTHYLSSAANSLIFRNDCYWLANQLTFSILNLPEAQQQHFNQSITYLKDASIYLQELGNAWYELALMRCFRTLQSVLETLDGFTGMAENMKFQKDCDHAMSKIIELVGSYAAEIQSVVDEQTLFLDILGRIVDYVLNYLIQDIESLVDIGADESHIIAQNLNRLMGLVGAFDLPGQDATENLIINLVPSWQKFWLLKDILEMNMRDIMDAFRRGKLHMFEKSEMIGLLCSLFADTELREMNIKEIQEGSSYSTRLATDNESANSGLHPTIAAAEDQTLPTPTTGVSPPTSTITSYRPNMTTAPATLTDTKLHLNYSPDDMDIDAAAEGWGIDDDDTLFDNQDLPTGSADKIDEEENDTKKAATIDHSTISSSSSSVFPQKNHLAIMAGETDIEEATADGWADDDDDDLFRVERYLCKDDDEEDTDTKEINISKQPKIAVKERPETAMTSSSPLTIRDDIQDEEENDGWDDDELLFDEEDLR
ncbi:Centromere/kinetochore Zw10-domain-containing protein [Mycotypha africana]|uniref:Centromere/kinetochore Zw10-domain-containing protein n=1 Tax=Mycotypha africana TaxID=64632 RepID=UPI002300913E|nr:Centromere/kinetochore Zw10-domain-containing protein [Mycotypha africana]KAI8977475.1 Centromere/kinetochore Zw10-domain-containing protein [Mycotypha africana]